MAAQTPPPPPGAGAAPPTKKKGLHPLAWAGIGCVVLLLAGATLTLVGGIFAAKKAKELLGDGDPAMTAAKLIVAASPEIELVDSDDATGTLTVRNTQTGEEITVDLSDIETGNFRFESDGKEVSIDGSGQGDGFVTVTQQGGEGEEETVLQIGGSSQELPEWVPTYPGIEPQGTFSMTENGVRSGGYQATTSDAYENVVGFFEAFGAAQGIELDRSLIEASGMKMTTLQSKSSDGPQFSATIHDQGGERSMVVSYRDAP